MQEERDRKLALNSKQIAAIMKLGNLLGYLPIDVNNLLFSVVDEIAKLFPFHKCSLKMVELDGKIRNILGEQGRISSLKTEVNCFTNGCTVIQDSLPIIGTEYFHKSQCQHLANKVKSFLCLPLESGKVKLGVMHLASEEQYSFSEVELEVLLCIANQTALAWQRYRLFRLLQIEKEELKRANEEVKALNQDLATKLQQLQTTQAQLIRAEKLATAGQMTADLAHEINNPIAIIISRLEYLHWQLEEGKNPENLAQDIKMLEKHSLRIADLTRDFLAFARPKDPNFSAVNLNQLVQESCVLLTKQLNRRGINVQFDLNSPLPQVWGNWDRLQQVLINLIYNARDAMPQGGELKIKTAWEIADSKVLLEVADTGDGIKQEHLSRIFDPFFTTKPGQKGTGLGLSISYNIIDQHGGEIKVFSEEGKGTIFSIRLKQYQSKSR